MVLDVQEFRIVSELEDQLFASLLAPRILTIIDRNPHSSNSRTILVILLRRCKNMVESYLSKLFDNKLSRKPIYIFGDTSALQPKNDENLLVKLWFREDCFQENIS